MSDPMGDFGWFGGIPVTESSPKEPCRTCGGSRTNGVPKPACTGTEWEDGRCTQCGVKYHCGRCGRGCGPYGHNVCPTEPCPDCQGTEPTKEPK